MLSKGYFVRYYGGCELLKDVAITGSPVGPLFIAGCALFQFSILIFKKIKMRKLNPQSRSPGNYELSCTVQSNRIYIYQPSLASKFRSSPICAIIWYGLVKRGIAKSSLVCEGAPKIAPSGRNEPKFCM